MNKPVISDSDKRLLLIFCAVLLVAASYFFFFSKSMEKASELEEQNAADTATVQQLETMEAALPQIREQIEALQERQAEIIAKYPSDLTTEKVIAVVQSIEDNNDFTVSDITFLMDNPVAAAQTETTDTTDTTDATADTTTDTADTTDTTADTTDTADATTDTADTAAAAEPVTGYYASVGLRFTASYAGLKDMIDYVNQYSDRMTITSLSAAYDSETGGLSGDLTLSMYYLTNTGREYETPEFPYTGSGVDNIFGGSAE